MIDRIRGRGAFQRLARDGRRIRRPALWCTWCPEPHSTTTSVAFALGRALGPAVVRNRLRRRLRVLIRTIDAQQPLPPGMLLIGANAATIELTFEELGVELAKLTTSLRSETARSTPSPS